MKLGNYNDIKKEDCMTCATVERWFDEVKIDLMYPPYENDKENTNAKYIEINLSAVRATDGVRIHFNYERGGWVIEQPTGNYDEQNLEIWEESAFLESWAKDKERYEKLHGAKSSD